MTTQGLIIVIASYAFIAAAFVGLFFVLRSQVCRNKDLEDRLMARDLVDYTMKKNQDVLRDTVAAQSKTEIKPPQPIEPPLPDGEVE